MIEIHTDTGGEGGSLRLRSGRCLTSDLNLWAIVGAVPDLAANSGLEVDARGRVVVDEFLRSVSDERIFAVGDCAAVPGARFACYTALPQALRGADNFARIHTGHKPKPHSFPYFARGVWLGRKYAVTQLTHADDSLRDAAFGGRTSLVLKEMATHSAYASARAGKSRF